MGFITTYTGKHFDPCNPDIDAVDIRDIAHALSLICRGNGHVKTFFSVGEHCIRCSEEALERGLSNKIALACLLHDATECYMSDVPSPLKHELVSYIETEEKLLEIIYRKYLGKGLTADERKTVKLIDSEMLYYDMKELLGETIAEKPPIVHISTDYNCRNFEEVEREYLSMFYRLTE